MPGTQAVRPPRAPLVVAGEMQYAFAHVLLRDVAYGQIPRPPERASMSMPPAGSSLWPGPRTRPRCSRTTT
jgi:hypothetical protein